MQEGRNSNDDIEDGWNVILENINKIEKSNEETVIIGDLNKLIGDGEYGVEGNNPKVTFGGKLIHDLLRTEKFILVNNSDKCTGGPFTRIDPSNPNIKSCLDLCIISKGLLKYLIEMVIDDKFLFTPHKATKKKLIYTDHLSIYIKFEGIPEVSKIVQKDGKLVSWNTRKEDGWKSYMESTTNNEELETLAENAKHLNSDQLMEKIDKMMNKIKFRCFGKVKISQGQGSARNRRLEELYTLKSCAVKLHDES